MGISIINIARQSSKFSSIRIVALLISMPVNIYVATVLIPAEYGVFGLLGLWLMYANLANPGLIEAGYREIPYLLGKDESKEALRVQNISITSDMLYSIIPFAAILGASFFFSEPLLKIGLIIIAISYAAQHFVAYWRRTNFVREKFNVVAKGNAITAIGRPVLIAAGVAWLKVYALIAVPIVTAIITGIYYWRKGPINYHFTFDWEKTVRLVKVGVVLAAASLAFVGFRMIDRTIIASMLSLEELGFYTYAIIFMTSALIIAEDFGNVLQPILWRGTGKAVGIFEAFQDTKRIAVYMALGAAVLIAIAQLGFYLIVSLITTKYVGSITVFWVLSYNLYLAFITMIPNIILTSSILNKQKIVLYFYSIGLALNIIFDILVIMLGYGIVGVAWVTICTQSLVTFALYYSIKRYIFRGTKEFVKFQMRIAAPFLACIPFYFLHYYLDLATSNLWFFAGVSLGAQVIIWSLVISIFYRDYLSISDFRRILREIRVIIRERFPK